MFRRILLSDPVPVHVAFTLDMSALIDAGQVPEVIRLLPLGTWKGHSAGRYTITSETVAEMVDNYAAQNVEPPIDYEHNSEKTDVDKAVAAGWIKELIDRGGDGLWGRIEWTDTARRHIEAKEYRYISPAFHLSSVDNKTGERVGAKLTSVALTNRPFLVDQDPLTLTATAKGNPVKFLEKLATMLKLSGKNITEEKVAAEVQRLRASSDLSETLLSSARAALKLDDKTPASEVVTAVTVRLTAKPESPKDDKFKAGVLDMFKLSEIADLAEVQEAFGKVSTKDTDLALKLANLTKEVNEGKSLRAYELADEAGKIAPSLSDWAKGLALRDPEGFAKWVEATPVVKPSKLSDINRNNDIDTITLSDNDKQLCKSMGIDEADYLADMQKDKEGKE